MKNIQLLVTLTLLTGLLLACTPDRETGEATSGGEGPESIETPAGDTSDTGNFQRSEHMMEQLQFLMGKFEPSEHPDFVRIDPKYASREDMYMQREAYKAFVDMHQAAREDGIDLTIVSAARNFEYQKGIWERKWSGESTLSDGTNLGQSDLSPAEKASVILRYSAMPGTSRHHWGTDIDLNELNNEYFEQGEGKKVYDWLNLHASEYGYCQPYNAKGPGRSWGYEEEKWHWSYKPLAKLYLSDANTLVRNEDITGFAGADVAQKMLVKEKYILGVNDVCK